MRWAGHVACMGRRRCTHRVLVGKPAAKRPLGRPRHRWKDNIKTYLQAIVLAGGVDCIDLAENRCKWWDLVYMLLNPPGSI